MKPSLLLFLLILCAVPARAAQLPVVIELDRYLVEARQLIKQEEFSEAKIWLTKAEQLDVALPPDFYYLNGKYLFSIEQFKDAEVSIIKYLTHTGRLGSYYNDALGMITALERQLKTASQKDRLKREEAEKERSTKSGSQDQQSMAAASDEQEMLVENQGIQLIDRIKKFTENQSGSSVEKPYQTIQDAINKLLREHAIFERYGVKEPTLVYSVKANYGDMLVITRSEQGMEGLEVASHNVTIKSIPEQLNSECSWQEQRCWIRHPLNNQRWLEINYSEDATDTLAAHLEELIKTMRNES